jgi:hypothetical protein
MRLVILTVAAAAVLAGCGGAEPRLTRTDAVPLITLTTRIAQEGACAQARDIAALRTRAVRLFNQRRVPARLQEPFLSGVNALAEQSPACVPTVTPAPTSPPPKPGKGRGKGHGKDHEHGDQG